MSTSQHVSDSQPRARGARSHAAVRARSPRAGRGRLVRRALVTADALAIVLAAIVARVTAGGGTFLVAVGVLAAAIIVWIVAASTAGLYRRDEQRADQTTAAELWPLLQLATLGTWLAYVGAWVAGQELPISTTLAFWGTAIVALPVSRAVARTVVRRFPGYSQNTLIVGAGDVGQLVGRKLRHHPEWGVRLVGFVDTRPKEMRDDLEGVPIVGEPHEILDLVRDLHIQRVIVAFSNDRHDLQLELIRALHDVDVQIDVVPRLFEAVGPGVGVHTVEGLPLVGLRGVPASGVARATKRVVDVVVSASCLVVFSPFFLAIAVLIRRGSPGPVFFRQERLGKDMRPFEILKFRTMAADTDDRPHREYVGTIMNPHAAAPNGTLYKLERPEVRTRIGRWLRRTSLDELPQLVNVLRGDMSLVGPRPCMEYETGLFEPHHFDRFLVPAGMTGLWQVSARANSSFREALDLDAAYARNWSLGLDLQLLARTPAAVFRGKEATS
jgi:exopolysaccharide biosynthesis polyprenyl glycosylphosphotransferase